MKQQNDPIKSTLGESAGEIVAITLNAVPMVGGVLSGIANSIIAKRQNRRLNDFLLVLANQYEEFLDRINHDFVQTEEFEDLTEDVFSKASECRQKEKLDAFRFIFLNSILTDRPNYDTSAEILDLVNRWQPRHVILTRILADPLAADAEKNNAVGSGGGITTSIGQILSALLPTWSDDQISRTWKDLYDHQIHQTSGTKTMMTDRGIHQLENRLTSFGQTVAKYISDPSSRT